MAIRVDLSSQADVADLIGGLNDAADRWESTRPILARKYRALANRFADQLDALPESAVFGVEVKARVRTHDVAVGRG